MYNNIYTYVYIVSYIYNNFQLQHKTSNLIKDLSIFNLVNIFKESKMCRFKTLFYQINLQNFIREFLTHLVIYVYKYLFDVY